MPSLAGSPALALLATALVACGPPAPASPRSASGRDVEGGWITGSPGAAPSVPSAIAAAPLPPPAPWELAPEMATFTSATPRGRSQHFTGELEAEVRINAAAAGYPSLGPSRALPAGATLVEAHYLPGGAQPAALLAMTKRPPGYDPEGGDWEFLVLTPAGVAVQRGRLPLCRRCHAEAPHDRLFGGPR